MRGMRHNTMPMKCKHKTVQCALIYCVVLTSFLNRNNYNVAKEDDEDDRTGNDIDDH